MANSVMRLSFNLNNWAECGGDSNRSEQEAQDESFVQADEAIRLFKEVVIMIIIIVASYIAV